MGRTVPTYRTAILAYKSTCRFQKSVKSNLAHCACIPGFTLIRDLEVEAGSDSGSDECGSGSESDSKTGASTPLTLISKNVLEKPTI